MTPTPNADMSDYTPAIDESWVERAAKLYEETVLSERQADIQALKEQGATRQDTADELGISVNTVDEHRREIKERIERAKKTVEELG
jgi:DNA-binding CsgD family transcriptional regulator